MSTMESNTTRAISEILASLIAMLAARGIITPTEVLTLAVIAERYAEK